MPSWQRIGKWLGIASPDWLRNAIARRNMPIVLVGAILVVLFSGMLSFCLLTGTPCSVDGFDEAAYENPAATPRLTAACLMAFVLGLAVLAYAAFYLRRKWEHPHMATIVTVVFAFLFVMLWGIAESGTPIMRQVLIFASLQFLVAGLIVLTPLVALGYFAVTFYLFGTMAGAAGEVFETLPNDLAYLAILDMAVCWVVYGLFARAVEREQTVLLISQRDELTGAKNRHCLRHDFPAYQDSDLFVMLCDVDDFKHYNDTFSHSTGDEMIKQFYYSLREAFGDECVYRYGGDEFLVVSPNLDPGLFERKVQKVSEQLALVEIEGRDAELTYTGGYVRGVATSSAGFRTMLHRADENLLEAKRAGKNQLAGS